MKLVIVALGALLVAAPVRAQQTRLPPTPPERYDEAQTKAAADFEAALKRRLTDRSRS